MNTQCSLCYGRNTGGCAACNPINLDWHKPGTIPDTHTAPVGLGVQKGWECPRCSRIYSPVCLECSHCNKLIGFGTITTVISGNNKLEIQK